MSTDAPRMMLSQNIQPVHTCIKGRARFRSKALRGRSAKAARLERHLSHHPAVRRVAVSSVTGSVLVRFDPSMAHEQVAQWVTGALAACDMPPVKVETTDAYQIEQDWFQLSRATVLAQLQSHAVLGLSREEAQRRLVAHGANTEIRIHGRGTAAIWVDQITALPSVFLAVENALVLATGGLWEAGLLAAVIVANCVVGYWIDAHGERALLASQHRPGPMITVIREGNAIPVAGETVVVGDILELGTGTFVGADARLIVADHLKVDESMLTGESIPVDKSPQATGASDGLVSRRGNMVYKGTLVVGGTGRAVVVATGEETEYGKLQYLLKETVPPQTPMARSLHAITRRLAAFGGLVGLSVLFTGWLRGWGAARAVRTALSMASAIVPAGLPSAATLNLTLGISALGRRAISLQRLYALEALGSVGVICFDKTGTLTRTRLTVLTIAVGDMELEVKGRLFWLAGQPTDPLGMTDFKTLIHVCILCNESKLTFSTPKSIPAITGSPTEKALLALGFISEIDIEGIYTGHTLLFTRHRGAERRYMITAHATAMEDVLVCAKGDPDQILALCDYRRVEGQPQPLIPEDRSRIESQNEAMAARALRVLGFARKVIQAGEALETESGFEWIGLVGMAEPIRKGVPGMIQDLHTMGIRTVMVTGDQTLTAQAVAREIGMADGADFRILDTGHLGEMASEAKQALIPGVRLFARLNPAQKLDIVEAYRRTGQVVAMTGDGINDGPALRAADVGIAMGLSGTSVARDVADVVLTRDNIDHIVPAIAEGRTRLRNLSRATRFYLTGNLGALMLRFIGLLSSRLGPSVVHSPMSFNLVAEVAPGLAMLADRSPLEETATVPQKPVTGLFTHPGERQVFCNAANLTLSSLAVYAWGRWRHGGGARASAMAFETMELTSMIYALEMGLKSSNGYLVTAALAGMALQATSHLVPSFAKMTGTLALSVVDMAIMLGVAGFSIPLGQQLAKHYRLPAETESSRFL